MSDADAVNLVLLVLRVATGLMLFAHGWVHLKRVRQGPGVANWFGSLGMRQPALNAWVVTLVELGGGVMLVLGLLTPLAAASVTGVVVVAWITNHWSAGFFVYNRPTEGWEYVMILTVLGIALGTIGAGEWSLDRAFDIEWDTATNFWVTVVAGVGGALLQLLVFWRPPRAPATD
ncbi:MAG: DoxX family protein [Acidimicrobiia bacterium]